MGDAFISQKYYSNAATDLGYHYSLAFGKISGNFLFTYNQLLETETYDPNDMGFNERNNKFNNVLVLNYNIYEPFGKFLDAENQLRFAYNCLFDDFHYTSFTITGESMFTTLKHLTIGGNIGLYPLETHDYYEPRVPGYMYIRPADYMFSPWISTDYRKKLALDLFISGYKSSGYKSSGIGLTLGPRYRANDRLLLQYRLGYENYFNDVGYVLDSTDAAGNTVILFGRRDLRTITNLLQANFMFSSSMSMNLRLRHYWVTAPYYSFYRLRDDGNLDPVEFKQNQDLDYNLFNLDLTYVWNFAPGSQLSFAWKNAINTISNIVDNSYFSNFSEMAGSPASNSFSIRILYYLDAMYFKRKSEKRKAK
jgi:hypothetical protein